MKLYLAVTPDDFELPIFVTDSIKEMALKFGVKESTILSNIGHDLSGKYRGAKFIRVVVDDD